MLPWLLCAALAVLVLALILCTSLAVPALAADFSDVPPVPQLLSRRR